MKSIFLIYGNKDEQVANKRFDLIQKLLPHGEDDGEVVDLRPAGNQQFKLDKALNDIIQELGTVSLIPDAKRVVVVHELSDFRNAQRGSVRAAKKEAAGKKSSVERLEDYIKTALVDSENYLVFIHNDDDEKNRRVQKSSALFQLVNRYGEVYEFSEKRLDWQLEDALLSRNFAQAIELTREWLGRGGNAPFRLVITLNGFLQLLLQARLEAEERQRSGGGKAAAFFAGDIRPSISQIPDFKARKFRALCNQVPLERIRAALRRLNEVQKSFFPTGEEKVVHDPGEQIEVMYIELFS